MEKLMLCMTDATAEEKNPEQAQLSCCPPGAYPQLAAPKDYKPEGEWKDFNGTKCYVTGSRKWGACLIVCHDVYGPQTGYHYGVCDSFARGGYHVIMPDFYETVGGVDNWWSKGDSDGGAEFLKRFSWEYCEAKLKEVYAYIDKEGLKRTGALGFCWGAWVVARMSTDKDRIQSAVWYHPSLWVDNGLFGGPNEAAITEKVTCPTLFAPSFDEKRDFWDYEQGKKILEGKGIETDYVAFTRMHHGWMTRGAGGNGISFIQAGGTEMSIPTSQDVNRGIGLGLGWFAKTLFPNLGEPAMGPLKTEE